MKGQLGLSSFILLSLLELTSSFGDKFHATQDTNENDQTISDCKIFSLDQEDIVTWDGPDDGVFTVFVWTWPDEIVVRRRVVNQTHIKYIENLINGMHYQVGVMLGNDSSRHFNSVQEMADCADCCVTKQVVPHYAAGADVYFGQFAYACVVLVHVFWYILRNFRSKREHTTLLRADHTSFRAQTNLFTNEVELLEKKASIKDLGLTEHEATDFLECPIQCGYKSLWLGKFVLLMTVVGYSGICAMLIAVVCDYYGVFAHPSTLFGSKNSTQIQWLMVVWFNLIVWTIILVANRRRLRLFYALPCGLPKANLIAVWEPIQVEKFTIGKEHPLVRIMDWLTIKVVPPKLLSHNRTRFEICKVEMTAGGIKSITHQYEKCQWSVQYQAFIPVTLQAGKTLGDLHNAIQNGGLTQRDADKRLKLSGPNDIPLAPPSILTIAMDELISPFYAYQFLIYWIWWYWNYWNMGLVQVAVVCVAATFAIGAKRKNILALCKIIQRHCEVNVLRDGAWQTKDAQDLVIGDVIEVSDNGWLIPCDALVISGGCVVDESSLTGEAMPQHKTCIPTDALHEDFECASGVSSPHKGHMIFCATVCAQSVDVEGKAKAVVVKTGIRTTRGELVKNILWPKQLRFRFNVEMKVVFGMLFLESMLITGLVVYFLTLNGKRDEGDWGWFLWGVFAACQLINPLIPALLVVGQTMAAQRLKQMGIYCLNLARITVTGKVRLMCFDKTGTITQQGLNFSGVHYVVDRVVDNPTGPSTSTRCVASKASERVFDDDMVTKLDNSVNETVMCGLASCHAVTMVKGLSVGNQVEVNMFNATGWTMKEGVVDNRGICAELSSPDNKTTCKIVQRHEFSHTRMTMTVVVKIGQKYVVYTKGSYESVSNICAQSSIPSGTTNYHNSYTSNGHYTLAIAYRNLTANQAMYWTAPQPGMEAPPQDELEIDLTFIGFILFHNAPKPEAKQAMADLKAGATRVVMITGDNPLTAIHIAKATGMIPEGKDVVLLSGGVNPECTEEEATELIDTTVDCTLSRLGIDCEGVTEHAATFPMTPSEARLNIIANQPEIVMTGSAFTALKDAGQLSQSGVAGTEFGGLLMQTRIFARMQPVDKVHCVEEFMSLGIPTGMCGDGGNDCGALRAAHCGVALSDSEASIVSPFSSQPKTVTSVVDVLREGRCALATSFSCFKYFITLGQIIAVEKLLSSFFMVTLSPGTWICLDGVLSLGLSIGITYAKPCAKLAAQRPTSSLLSPLHIASVVQQMFFYVMSYVIIFWQLFQAPWYKPLDALDAPAASWWAFVRTPIASVFVTMMFQQIICGSLVYTMGGAFRRPLLRNYILMTVVALYEVLWLVIVLVPTKLSEYIQFCNVPDLCSATIPVSFRVFMVLVALVDTIFCLAVEYYVLLGPVGRRIRNWYKDRLRDDFQVKL